MIQKTFQTIDGETLMSRPLQPLNFIVDSFLSQGLHILAGASKVGKSWLALWLSVCVAKGEPVWGMPVTQGTTLYRKGTAGAESSGKESSYEQVGFHPSCDFQQGDRCD